MDEIKKHNLSSVLETIAEADPELHVNWVNYLSKEYENGKYLNERSFFDDMNAIASYIIKKWESGKTDSFSKLFDTIEHIFRKQDSDTCSVLSAGLLESIHREDVDYYYGFDQWLQPKTKEWWQGAIDYWEGTEWRQQKG